MQLITRRTALAALATLTTAGFGRKHAVAAELKPLPKLSPDDPPLPLPPLRLVAADGSAHGLADFAGQGLVLNCWATWCIPCVAEMPALAGLAAHLTGDRIAVIPLSSDRGGKDAVGKFYREHEITGLPIWLDPDGDAVHALKLRGIPTTLIIDRQGRERGRVEGAADWASAESVAKIKALVG
jgi:thiol-disulfide isomerase/thioredoxin